MNIVFLSPAFPPNYYLFCTRLRALGAQVLGLGDEPYAALRPELRAALHEYYFVADLNNYDEALRALGYFTYRYGKIERIDSLNEHWLETDARLRSDFNVPGIKREQLPAIKRKSAMRQIFAQAGVAAARGRPAHTPDDVRAFVAEVGYPIVAKPDIGVGANKTYKLNDDQELEAFLARSSADYLLEEYVQGVIQTFDGLTDREGNPVFYTSMQYSRGVMEVVNDDGDVYYYTLRDVPSDIEQCGRSLLKAFDVRERFFHFEFFRTPEGRLVALEVNMRPPGGLTLDMFNFANDIDLYYEWANLLLHNRFSARFNWPFHVCYIGRKPQRRYRLSHAEVLARYGDKIVLHQPMAAVFQRAMGAYGYLLRSTDLDEVIAAAAAVQAT